MKGGVIGRIKFLDSKTKKWGFIIPEGGGENVHFSVRDISGDYKENYMEGAEVLFTLEIDPKGRGPAARNIIVTKHSDTPTRSREVAVRGDDDFSHKNKAFWEWATIPSSRPHQYDDEEYANVLHALKEVALPEEWYLGGGEDDRRYPLLRKYLNYTFDRLKNEEKIFYKEQDGRRWAVFNTGLVDKVYDPIYMLFNENKGLRPWRLFNLCIQGKRSPGKRLAELFNPCPPAAKYLDGMTELVVHPGAEILIDDEHIIEDAIEQDRYPPEFLRRYAPQGFEWGDDYIRFEKSQKKEYLSKYRKALEKDIVRYREIKNRIQDAIDLAKKRTFWNYKTAIPSYYPKRNQLDLLLPLCLDDRNDAVVTVALVVSRNRSGSYQGRTVYPLDWAYERARVVCRPDSDWLTPKSVAAPSVAEAEEAEGPPDEDAN